jgi:cyclic pyranopterin phosphate synthase
MQAAPPFPDPTLRDAQGRAVTYLRLSLTARCNFSCSYCSPEPDAAEDHLGREEAVRLVRVLAGLGVRRVRLTGGEPTLRADLEAVAREVASAPGVEEVALTTNGHRLEALAGRLRAAGVSRLNVSLDTLDAERFRALSGRAADLGRVLRGFAAAAAAGFASLKMNTVVVRGLNEGELGALARFAWRHGGVPRFIELMPFGQGAPVPMAEVRGLLEAQGVRLAPDATRGWGPARHMRGEADDGGRRVGGLVGFIGAMSESFCDGCNRVRIGPDGALRACLGGRERVPLLGLLRAGATDAELAGAVREALLLKGARHEMGAPGAGPLPPMVRIGG